MPFKFFQNFQKIQAKYESPLHDESHFFNYSIEDLLPPATSTLTRQREVNRVLNVAQDSKTGHALAEQSIASNALASRRGNDVFGDALVFKPTHPRLIHTIVELLKEISATFKKNISDEHYLIQQPEALHFSFGSLTSPCIQEEFLLKKRIQRYQVQTWSNLVYFLRFFLNQAQPSMRFKELKMNADGHIILRMTVQQIPQFLDLKDKIVELFSEKYERYETDPEKRVTLACVLAVVDLNAVDFNVKSSVLTKLNTLFSTYIFLFQNESSFSFDRIEWIEWTNRMLQRKDSIGILELERGWVKLTKPLLSTFLPKLSLLNEEQSNKTNANKIDQRTSVSNIVHR